MDLVAVFVLGLALGIVLGYWAAMPRVRRLDKESAQLYSRMTDLEVALDWERSKAMGQGFKIQ
jgi:hypothetical protein